MDRYPDGTPPGGLSVSAVMDHENGVIEVSVEGRWGRRSRLTESHLAVSRTVRKCLAEHPAGLILALDRLQDLRAASAPLWLTTAAQGREMEPWVPVVACLSPGTPLAGRIGRLDPRGNLPVFPSARLAMTSITSHRPQTSQVRLHLQPRLRAAATARQLVTAACEEWHMPLVLPRARLVVSELVANAVEHAGTPIDVVVSHRGPVHRTTPRGSSPRLHLAVYDRDPRMPQPQPVIGQPPGARGRGLRIVSVATESWGVLPTRDGKVVWAMLREQPD